MMYFLVLFSKRTTVEPEILVERIFGGFGLFQVVFILAVGLLRLWLY